MTQTNSPAVRRIPRATAVLRPPRRSPLSRCRRATRAGGAAAAATACGVPSSESSTNSTSWSIPARAEASLRSSGPTLGSSFRVGTTTLSTGAAVIARG